MIRTTLLFEIGDRVSLAGSLGNVIKILDNTKYPVVVKFDSGAYYMFTMDGKLQEDHLFSLLQKME